jgi:hypothetical protein
LSLVRFSPPMSLARTPDAPEPGAPGDGEPEKELAPSYRLSSGAGAFTNRSVVTATEGRRGPLAPPSEREVWGIVRHL